MVIVLVDLKKQAVSLCRSTRHLHYNYSQGTVRCIHSPWVIYPGVHGWLRRVCKEHREYIMFIDCKHTVQV